MKHDSLLNGLEFASAPRSEVLPPTLLRFDLGPQMVDTFLSQLERPDWLERLKARATFPERDDLPMVDQHMHKKACLVVVDAACLRPGFPRVDTAKVESAGMVIRREQGEAFDAWLNDAEGALLGWKPAPLSALSSDTRYEPDAARRRALLTRKDPALKHKASLSGDEGGVSEQTHPLFPIPPDKAAKIGRTLYFGVLPTTSMSLAPVEPPEPPLSLEDVGERVPNLLRAERTDDPLPPLETDIGRDEARNPSDPAIEGLVSTLTWLSQEAGLFTGEAYAAALRDLLGDIAIQDAPQANLFDWFEKAQAVLVQRKEGEGSSVRTPSAWPQISASQFETIRVAGYDAIAARWLALAPSVTRFGPIGERYHVRCFLRLEDEAACPPRTLWSPLSTSYRIRPWYESAGAPPQQIELPSLTAGNLSRFKPDVAIKVPPEIQQFMDKLNVNDLLDGNPKKNLDISFGMICGFSIPIITICAFIILQLFLSLLNIIFFWLPFVKICIPYPIVEEENN